MKLTERKRPARWKIHSHYRPTAYRLNRGEQYLVTAQKDGDGTWFWYGLGVNTAHRPLPTFGDIKRQVAEYLESPAGRAALGAQEKDNG